MSLTQTDRETNTLTQSTKNLNHKYSVITRRSTAGGPYSIRLRPLFKFFVFNLKPCASEAKLLEIVSKVSIFSPRTSTSAKDLFTKSWTIFSSPVISWSTSPLACCDETACGGVAPLWFDVGAGMRGAFRLMSCPWFGMPGALEDSEAERLRFPWAFRRADCKFMSNLIIWYVLVAVAVTEAG